MTAFVAFLLIGFGNPLVDVNFATVVQRVAPAAVLGRIFGALESALVGAMGLGALLFPMFLELVGLQLGSGDHRRAGSSGGGRVATAVASAGPDLGAATAP